MALSAQDPANHPGRVHACVPACVTACGARLCANVHVCEYILCSSTCTDASVCLQARVREHTHLYARVCPVCVCTCTYLRVVCIHSCACEPICGRSRLRVCTRVSVSFPPWGPPECCGNLRGGCAKAGLERAAGLGLVLPFTHPQSAQIRGPWDLELCKAMVSRVGYASQEDAASTFDRLCLLISILTSSCLCFFGFWPVLRASRNAVPGGPPSSSGTGKRPHPWRAPGAGCSRPDFGEMPFPGDPPSPVATELAAWRPSPWALGGLSLRLNHNANRTAIGFPIICSTGNKDRIVRACGKGQQFVWHKEFIFSFPDLSPITRPLAAWEAAVGEGCSGGVGGPCCPQCVSGASVLFWDITVLPHTCLSSLQTLVSLGLLLQPPHWVLGPRLWP